MESRPLYLGPRLKRLRRELGLTQAVMADDLAISPSYIALLERNQRPLTADLLLRLARSYKLDVSELAADERDDYARRLADVLKDPIFAEIDLPALEVADVATSYPGVTEAMLRLHTAYMREQQALASFRGGAGGGDSADPLGEARRFVAQRRHQLIEHATGVGTGVDRGVEGGQRPRGVAIHQRGHDLAHPFLAARADHGVHVVHADRAGGGAEQLFEQ